MFTLKAAFWFNIKIDYLGVFVSYSGMPHWIWKDSATVVSPLGQDMAELKRAHCSQQWFLAQIFLHMTIYYCNILLIIF